MSLLSISSLRQELYSFAASMMTFTTLSGTLSIGICPAAQVSILLLASLAK